MKGGFFYPRGDRKGGGEKEEKQLERQSCGSCDPRGPGIILCVP